MTEKTPGESLAEKFERIKPYELSPCVVIVLPYKEGRWANLELALRIAFLPVLLLLGKLDISRNLQVRYEVDA